MSTPSQDPYDETKTVELPSPNVNDEPTIDDATSKVLQFSTPIIGAVTEKQLLRAMKKMTKSDKGPRQQSVSTSVSTIQSGMETTLLMTTLEKMSDSLNNLNNSMTHLTSRLDPPTIDAVDSHVEQKSEPQQPLVGVQSQQQPPVGVQSQQQPPVGVQPQSTTSQGPFVNQYGDFDSQAFNAAHGLYFPDGYLESTYGSGMHNGGTGSNDLKYGPPRSGVFSGSNQDGLSHNSGMPDPNPNPYQGPFQNPSTKPDPHYDYYGRRTGAYSQGDSTYNQSQYDSVTRLNPHQSLSIALKANKIQKLSMTQASYIPWLNYMKTILASMFLSSIAYMFPHQVPVNESGWGRLDNSPIFKTHYDAALKSLRENFVPVTMKGQPLEYLNGVFIATISYFSTTLHTIFQVLINSIDDSMKFLIKETTVTATNFRMIFFGARKHFELSTEIAKIAKIKDFLNSSYSDTEPIEAFAVKIIKKSEHINDLYNSIVLSKELTKVVFTSAVTSKTGTKYTNLLDTLHLRKADFEEIVRVLNEKYLDYRSKNATNLELTFSADHNKSQHEMIDDKVYAVGDFNSNTKRLPCFQFKQHGKCSYGPKCKYSHDPKVIKSYVPNSSEEFANLLQDQLYNSYEVILFVTKQRNKYKKQYHRSQSRSDKNGQKNKSSFNKNPSFNKQPMTIEKAIANSADHEEKKYANDTSQEQANSAVSGASDQAISVDVSDDDDIFYTSGSDSNE